MRIGANTLSFAQFWQTKQKKKITGKLFVNEANKQNKTKLLRAACYRWKRNSHGGGNRVSGAIARLSSS